MVGLLDRQIYGAEMSEFTTAEIPDMSAVDPEQDHWLANYILNTILSVSVPTPQRQQLFNFLRRCHSALTEYSQGRTSTLAFLADRSRQLRYLEAIDHWEAFLAYSWRAYQFLAGGRALWFNRGDGSVLERLWGLHTRVKHADEAVVRGDIVGDSPLCLWLTNDGLTSTDMTLTFNELGEIVKDLAAWASAVQNPQTLREKLSSNYEDSESETHIQANKGNSQRSTRSSTRNSPQ